MVKPELIRLVKSLSGSEKRYFKLFCKKQSGSKDYLELFDMINQQSTATDPKSIEIRFKGKCPGKSYENTAQYLFKLIPDALIQMGAVNDKWLQQHLGLMRSKILFERSIVQEGYKELKKVQNLAREIQDNSIQYLSFRQELNFLSERGFAQMSEQDLVETQMKAKNILRNLHQIQEHSSLFELLRYRLIHSGRSLSNKDKMELNDLLISELSLATRGSRHNFETQKMHLLFQSFFLIHIGDYKSSLKSFTELNHLFERNEDIWNFPPYEYLYTLEGILDNLRTIKYYEEMEFYINKIEKLLGQKYPEYFQAIARQTIYIYQLNVLINKNEPSKAIQLSKSIPAALLKNESLVDYEKHTELLFYIGLAFFCTEDFQKANKHMSRITAIGKVKGNSSVYKASWLMHILVHYELDNLSYLDYEIRAYKRTFKKAGKALKIERLVFKLIKYDPKRKNKFKNLNVWNKIEKDMTEINQSNYEKQVLKYYDFSSWIKNKLVQP
jgi:hypothetical protein